MEKRTTKASFGGEEKGRNENKNEGKSMPGFVQKEEKYGGRRLCTIPSKEEKKKKKRGKVKLTTHPHRREEEGNWLSL